MELFGRMISGKYSKMTLGAKGGILRNFGLGGLQCTWGWVRRMVGASLEQDEEDERQRTMQLG